MYRVKTVGGGLKEPDGKENLEKERAERESRLHHGISLKEAGYLHY